MALVTQNYETLVLWPAEIAGLKEVELTSYCDLKDHLLITNNYFLKHQNKSRFCKHRFGFLKPLSY